MLKDHFSSLSGRKIMTRRNGALFVVMEGPDGVGKTTQAGLLEKYLEKRGHKVILTAEPTLYGKIGQRIERILAGEEIVPPMELQKLFAADRAEHVKQTIMPALAAGDIVISDRYFFSTFAYGPQGQLEKLIEMNAGFISPDIAFCLKAGAVTCLQRLKSVGRKLELFEKRDKLTEVMGNYLKLAGRFSNLRMIEGDRPINDVDAELIKMLMEEAKI